MRQLLAAAAIVMLATGVHAMTYGEKLAACLACQGEKGISETAEVPSLAGQPADFTLIQLFLFRQNTRKIEIMNDLAKDMTDDDLRKFSDYFAKLPAPKASGDPVHTPTLFRPSRTADTSNSSTAGSTRHC